MITFALAITTVTGMLFGVLPALRATAVDVNVALKDAGRAIVGTRNRIGNSLLIAQVAMALTLMIAAGLFAQTLRNLRGVEVGFNPDNLLLFRLNAEPNRYELPRLLSLYEEFDLRFRALPGVQRVAMSDLSMLGGGVSSTAIFVEGRQYAPRQMDQIHRVVVSPSYFETLEIPLLAGRGIQSTDGDASVKVAVINLAAARQFFEGAALGRRFGQSPEHADIEVVGVVGDVKYASLRAPAPPTLYMPYRQVRDGFSPVFQLRTAGDPGLLVPSVRAAAREIDRNVPLVNVSTQAAQIDARVAQERTFAQATSLFGLLASLLAAVGLFGLTSYSVSRRTNEIGVRMALGAQATGVLTQILRESLWLTLAGVVAGVALATALGRLVSSQLFGVVPMDPGSILGASVLMLFIGLLAAYLPARRAARVDPLAALRTE